MGETGGGGGGGEARGVRGVGWVLVEARRGEGRGVDRAKVGVMVVVTVVVYPIDERRTGGARADGGGRWWKEGCARAPRSRIYYFVTKPFLAL